MPRLKKAELLRGIVHMPSPVSLEMHAEPHADLAGGLFRYKRATPGLRTGDNATVRLGPEDDPQPDLLMMIPRPLGGQAEIGRDGFVEGAPELVVEVASSSASYDLHVKLEVYRDYGVREYLVYRVRDRLVDWYALEGRRFVPLPRNAGVVRSRVFPGLWLDVEALVAGDVERMDRILQEGLESPEHRAFRRDLQSRRCSARPGG